MSSYCTDFMFCYPARSRMDICMYTLELDIIYPLHKNTSLIRPYSYLRRNVIRSGYILFMSLISQKTKTPY